MLILQMLGRPVPDVELAPKEVSPLSTVEDSIKKLTKDCGSTETTVGGKRPPSLTEDQQSHYSREIRR